MLLSDREWIYKRKKSSLMLLKILLHATKEQNIYLHILIENIFFLNYENNKYLKEYFFVLVPFFIKSILKPR